MFRHSALIAWLALAVPQGAAAQRADLAAHRDSLATVTDQVWLREEAARIASGAAGHDGIAAGLAALRLYELTGDAGDAKRARVSFERVRHHAPGDAWAAWAVGLSWASGPEIRSRPTIVAGRAITAALGLDPASRAMRAFREALALDPGLHAAAASLAPLAIEARDRGALHEARRSLRLAAASGSGTPHFYVTLASVERALGDFTAAADAARLAEAARTTPGLAAEPEIAAAETQLAIARSLFGVPGEEDVAARAWFAGIGDLSPATAESYFEDVRLLADAFDRERWERADLDGRKTWLRQFWSIRAALAGVPVAQRIAEHYRRLEHARAWYPRRRMWGAPPGNALLLERLDVPFDDRGVIWVRHGEPVDIIRTLDANLSNESWVYRAADGGFRMLHFANYGSAVRSGAVGNPEFSTFAGGGGDAYNEYVLVWNLPCGGGWIGDRARYDPSLSLMRSCSSVDVRSVSAEARQIAREALRSDTHAPDFARELPFFYDLHTFRGTDGRTDLVAALIIAGDEIEPAGGTSVPGGVQYGVAVSLIVVDTMFEQVTRLDTTVWLETDHRLGAAEWLRAHITLPVAPSTTAVQRLIVRDPGDAGHGQVYGRPVELPDYARRALAISDIVLAEPDVRGTWRRGDVALSFVPTRIFAGGAFNTFYEIYGLPAETPFATEIVVERPRGGIGRAVRRLFSSGPPARLRFDGLARADADGVLRELRRIETSLDPGRYHISVRITNRTTGETVERTREFTVIER